jgi:ABC-type phosphate transport system auxiliary subunit
MSINRIILRIVIVLVCALVGVGLGVWQQTLRITIRPQQFSSIAKLVAGGQLTFNDSIIWREQQQDFYGTIIETIESAEMKRRALERVKALNPDLQDSDVEIRVAQTKGSAIFNILATGPEPKYTRIFLDALLDEFISFRQSIREQAQGKVLQQFLQEVVTKQKTMEDSMAKLEKARAGGVATLSVRSDLERLVPRLNSQRNQRDDLRLKIKSMRDDDASRSPLQTQLEAIEAEIHDIEKDLDRREASLDELKTLQEKLETDKLAYEKLFEQVEKIQSVFNASSDYVAIQERATPAFEHVEDWVMPAVGAGVVGGFLCGFIGLVLSLLLVRAPRPPQIPTAIG